MSLAHLGLIWVHILAACVWIGGMAFLAFAAIPALRSSASDRAYLDSLEAVATRFRRIGWGAIGTLVATGLLQLWMRPSAFGPSLALKIFLVIVAIQLAFLHDFRLGPRSIDVLREAPTSEEGARLRRTASWLARATFVLSLATVALAVRVARGLP